MIMKDKAIRALYPKVVSICEIEGATDKNGKKVTIDQKLVDAWVDPDGYKQLRKDAYPPVTDYLDGIAKADDLQVQKYIDECFAVKAKYPKGK